MKRRAPEFFPVPLRRGDYFIKDFFIVFAKVS